MRLSGSLLSGCPVVLWDTRKAPRPLRVPGRTYDPSPSRAALVGPRCPLSQRDTLLASTGDCSSRGLRRLCPSRRGQTTSSFSPSRFLSSFLTSPLSRPRRSRRGSSQDHSGLVRALPHPPWRASSPFPSAAALHLGSASWLRDGETALLEGLLGACWGSQWGLEARRPDSRAGRPSRMQAGSPIDAERSQASSGTEGRLCNVRCRVSENTGSGSAEQLVVGKARPR